MKNLITFSANQSKNILFLDVMKKSEDIINKMDPLKNINQFISKNRGVIMKNQTELLDYRIYQLTKYKLSLFLNREIQQEIYLRGNLVSNKLNNEIVSERFSFYEDSTNNMFLHKKIDDYFVMIHFRYLKPNVDKKYIQKLRNEELVEYYKKFGDDMGVFRKLTGADDNPDFQEAEKEELHSKGVEEIEDYYPDYTPFHFNINILNANSEMMQFVCYSEENQVY